MEIITNNKPRQLIYGYELTDKEKQKYSFLDDINSYNFVRYKGSIYAIDEFMLIHSDDPLREWDRYTSNNLFNGVLIKFINSDTVIMGTYIS